MRTLILLLLLSGCGAHADDQTYAEPSTGAQDSAASSSAAVDTQGASPSADPGEYAPDTSMAVDPDEADPANVDASDVDEPSFACTEDCSGHEAGFNWAKEHDVTDPSECGGDSQSFTEGCEGFAEQRQEQASQEIEDAAADDTENQPEE